LGWNHTRAINLFLIRWHLGGGVCWIHPVFKTTVTLHGGQLVKIFSGDVALTYYSGSLLFQ
jgi:hypothetical protein